jgi:hypothetical protein
MKETLFHCHPNAPWILVLENVLLRHFKITVKIQTALPSLREGQKFVLTEKTE